MDGDALFGLLVVVGWVLCVVFGIILAKRKNRSPHWMWFGLHPLGALIVWIVMLCVGPLKRCPDCRKKVEEVARVCPYCTHPFASPGG